MHERRVHRDRKVPKWREKLPINAEDTELSDLLTGLITEMHRLTSPSSQRSKSESGAHAPAASGETIAALKVKTLLTEFRCGWQLSRKIALEARFSDAQIAKWPGDADASPLYILVEHANSENTPTSLRNWAKLTRYSTGAWKRNWLSDAEDQIGESSIDSRVRLLPDDEKRTEIPCLFGSISKQLPLLFIEDKNGWLHRGACQGKWQQNIANLRAAEDAFPALKGSA